MELRFPLCYNQKAKSLTKVIAVQNKTLIGKIYRNKWVYGRYVMLRKVSPPLHFLQCWMRSGRERNLGGLSELFLLLPRGRYRGGPEIMKGLLMAFFAIYGQVRTGFIARVTFRKGSCASFLVPTKSLYLVGIPSEPR